MDIQSLQDENFKDMDLIEILWMQDIDMGVSKETFNSCIRKELEKKEETELLKAKEETKLSSESQELDCIQTEINNDEITYIIDVETGELVPAPPGTVLPDSQPMEVEQPQNSNSMQVSFEDALSILAAESKSPINNPLMGSNTALQNEIDNLVQNMSGLSYSRQSSLEGRWEDVQGFINSETSAPIDTPIIKTDDDKIELTSVVSELNILLQNSAMGIVDSQNNIVNFSQPSGLNNDIVPMNLTDNQNMFTTNTTDNTLSTLFPHTADMGPNTGFLQDLLSNMKETDGTDLLPIKIEDSDSAIGSMSSIGSASPLQDFGDSDSNLTSPFDLLEGATSHISTETVDKYEPYESGNTFSTIDWNADQSSNLDETTDMEFPLKDQDETSSSSTSYPLTPKQDDRQVKLQQKEVDKRISRSRDERKAKALKIPISVEDIIHSQVEQFNDMISRHKLTDKQLQLIKDIRRRGKNKVAAQNCRKRKMEVIETLEESVIRMRREKEHLKRQQTDLKKNRNQFNEKYTNLYKDIFRTLRDEQGKLYDPKEYTLQHTPEGNVFLVPKSTMATSGDPELKDIKKRKGRRK